VEGATCAGAGAGEAMERSFSQRAPFGVDKRPTRWWGRCSTTVQMGIMLAQEKQAFSGELAP
jgi:hypothetical protein